MNIAFFRKSFLRYSHLLPKQCNLPSKLNINLFFHITK